MDDMCIQRTGTGKNRAVSTPEGRGGVRETANKLIRQSEKFHNAYTCGRCQKSYFGIRRELTFHILPKSRVLPSSLQATIVRALTLESRPPLPVSFGAHCMFLSVLLGVTSR